MRCSTCLTSPLCASSRCLDEEANICSSCRTSKMTTFTSVAPPERGPSYYGVTIFLGDAPSARVCQNSHVHRLHARESLSPVVIASVKELRYHEGQPPGWPHRFVKREKVGVYRVQ
jgi:hypothetical protein